MVEQPKSRKLVRNKWIYKVKYKLNKEIDKHKACLVAKGFTRKPGVDFIEMYSPIIWYESIWAIFAIEAAKGMYLKQFDIATTFLNSDLSEEL